MKSRELLDLAMEIGGAGHFDWSNKLEDCAAKMTRMESMLRSFVSGFTPRIGEIKELLAETEH